MCVYMYRSIVNKDDKPGIDIIIKPETKHESVDIPVILSESGSKETVYNDFYIGDDCDIVIVAGCGIHNDGSSTSRARWSFIAFLSEKTRV